MSALSDSSPVAQRSAELEAAGLAGIDQRVSLAFDEQILAGTLRRWEGCAEIELDGPAPMPLPGHALLQYMSPRGIMRHHGALSAGGRDTALRVDFTPSGQPQLLLARQRLRADLRVPVRIDRADGTTLESFSIDLSETGILLALGEPLELGEHVEMRIYLDRFSPSITASSVIVRFDEEGHAAAHHTKVGKDALEQLCWGIFNCLLDARQR